MRNSANDFTNLIRPYEAELRKAGQQFFMRRFTSAQLILF
jgi:hypothetical protein